jgi:hypothetical protein
MGSFQILNFITGLAGFFFAVAITVAVVYFARKPINSFLNHILQDEVIAKTGTTFVIILLALEGFRYTFGFITQPQVNTFFNGLSNLLNGLAGVIQWVVYIAALLFIGFSIQKFVKSEEE